MVKRKPTQRDGRDFSVIQLTYQFEPTLTRWKKRSRSRSVEKKTRPKGTEVAEGLSGMTKKWHVKIKHKNSPKKHEGKPTQTHFESALRLNN